MSCSFSSNRDDVRGISDRECLRDDVRGISDRKCLRDDVRGISDRECLRGISDFDPLFDIVDLRGTNENCLCNRKNVLGIRDRNHRNGRNDVRGIRDRKCSCVSFGPPTSWR